MNPGKIIGIDFDGTCVEHAYPNVGKDVPYAVDTLTMLRDAGHKLILWTMRSDAPLQDAIDWFCDYDLPLFGINSNPEQVNWTRSPKAYCNLYIDDAAFGCPLIYPAKGMRPYVNWDMVQQTLLNQGWFRHR